jgi:hypothetical protein
MATFKAVYPADSQAITITLASLASSSTFLAGAESGAISNRSTLDLDHILSGKIRVGTTPTINTQIQVWVVPLLKLVSATVTYPDVMDGTASAETWTSAGVRDGSGVLVKTLSVDATTSDRDYYFGGISLAAIFGSVPSDYVVYVTHNSGVALNATGTNHELYYQRLQAQSV